MPDDEIKLTLEEKKILMRIAKIVVSAVVNKESVPVIDIPFPKLKEFRGAFVTLKIDGELRGCIGYVMPIKPLFETVADVAEAAALRDPRFHSVQPQELTRLHFEISALSPLREIKNISEIIIGEHGLVIEKGYRKGLLLPQVATEWNWDLQQFLEHTCLKANLHRDAWKEEDCVIKVFSAEVFAEEDLLD